MAYKYGTWQLTWLAKFIKPFGDRSGSVSTLARAAQARQVWHSGLVGYFLFGGKDQIPEKLGLRVQKFRVL